MRKYRETFLRLWIINSIILNGSFRCFTAIGGRNGGWSDDYMCCVTRHRHLSSNHPAWNSKWRGLFHGDTNKSVAVSDFPYVKHPNEVLIENKAGGIWQCGEQNSAWWAMLSQDINAQMILNSIYHIGVRVDSWFDINSLIAKRDNVICDLEGFAECERVRVWVIKVCCGIKFWNLFVINPATTMSGNSDECNYCENSLNCPEWNNVCHITTLCGAGAVWRASLHIVWYELWAAINIK